MSDRKTLAYKLRDHAIAVWNQENDSLWKIGSDLSKAAMRLEHLNYVMDALEPFAQIGEPDGDEFAKVECKASNGKSLRSSEFLRAYHVYTQAMREIIGE